MVTSLLFNWNNVMPSSFTEVVSQLQTYGKELMSAIHLNRSSLTTTGFFNKKYNESLIQETIKSTTLNGQPVTLTVALLALSLVGKDDNIALEKVTKAPPETQEALRTLFPDLKYNPAPLPTSNSPASPPAMLSPST